MVGVVGTVEKVLFVCMILVTEHLIVLIDDTDMLLPLNRISVCPHVHLQPQACFPLELFLQGGDILLNILLSKEVICFSPRRRYTLLIFFSSVT